MTDSRFGDLKPLMLKGLYLGVGALCLLWPVISSAYALFLGLLFGVFLTNPWSHVTKTLSPRFLSLAVIGLGAGMDLNVVARVGVLGFFYTFIGIAAAIGIGAWLGRQLKVNPNTSILISVGTAICGGSAIASVAPVLKAKPHEISIALGIVFLLNSLALLIFPQIGHAFALTQEQFGLWSALAIHDTSSVVGAALVYGDEALRTATTIKLARALWIVPVTLTVGIWVARSQTLEANVGSKSKTKYPWFILGFVVAAAMFTYIPAVRPLAHSLEWAAKRLMVLTLFIIGSNLNKEILRGMGFRPVVEGTVLWLLMASGTLIAIVRGWIRV